MTAAERLGPVLIGLVMGGLAAGGSAFLAAADHDPSWHPWVWQTVFVSYAVYFWAAFAGFTAITDPGSWLSRHAGPAALAVLALAGMFALLAANGYLPFLLSCATLTTVIEAAILGVAWWRRHGAWVQQ